MGQFDEVILEIQDLFKIQAESDKKKLTIASESFEEVRLLLKTA